MTSYESPPEATKRVEEVMKKSVLILIAAVCVVTPSFAQSPEPPAVVAQILALSQDQRTQWIAILQARQTAMQPFAEKAQAARQAVDQALSTENPDPSAVGQAIVALHSIQLQVATINSQAASEFEKLLTPDQLQRLNDIRGAAHACPIVPAFAATGLLDR
ncbi:MAG TPA: DUF2673 domain-containing protein [Thermoanaerobaculia bacterium]